MIECPNARDQILFCAFHSFSVEVQTNASYIQCTCGAMMHNNLETRIADSFYHLQISKSNALQMYMLQLIFYSSKFLFSFVWNSLAYIPYLKTIEKQKLTATYTWLWKEWRRTKSWLFGWSLVLISYNTSNNQRSGSAGNNDSRSKCFYCSNAMLCIIFTW